MWFYPVGWVQLWIPWMIPEDDRPAVAADLRPLQQDYKFDLTAMCSSVVGVRTEAVQDGYTVDQLGASRYGHGVAITDDGLILTAGYLIIETAEIWLIASNGRASRGDVVGYDQESGFGLVRALDPLFIAGVTLGRSADMRVGDNVILAASGGLEECVAARVAAKREFTGYWEYVIDHAIFTTPSHPSWGGAGLFDHQGRLCGIGSLLVHQESDVEEESTGNMCIPIDLLSPILEDLLSIGRRRQPSRPWLGLVAGEFDGRVVVARVTRGGPAAKADLQEGDELLGIGDQPVTDMTKFFRQVWSLGSAGVQVPLVVQRDGRQIEVNVESGARTDFLKMPPMH